MDNLVARLRNACERVLPRFPQVQLAYLFGSAACGKAGPLSDTDVAVVLKGHPTKPDVFALETEIEVSLTRASDVINLDLHIVNDAPLLLRGDVVNDGILLYSRDDAFRTWFEATTRSRYLDFLPSARQMAATFAAEQRQRQRAAPVTLRHTA